MRLTITVSNCIGLAPTAADDHRDSQNDPVLSRHKEETYAQDAAATIADAWWSQVADNDKDGCVAPNAPGALLRLNWDPDLLGGGSLNVYEKVYRRTPGTGNWGLVHTTGEHTINGIGTADAAYVDLPPAGGCAQNEYRIEIYRAGGTLPDFTLAGDTDRDLAPRKEESWVDDNVVALASLSWANLSDNDGDGCVAPSSAKAGFRLQWDVDVVGGGTLSVYEKVFRKGLGDWVLLATTPPHNITGASPADAQQLEVAPAADCVQVEYRLEVFRAQSTTPDLIVDGNNNPAFSQRKEETFASDTPTAAIVSTTWSGQADADGDGCLAPTSSGATVRLSWTPQVIGGSAVTILEKVYRRTSGGSWTLVGITFPQPLTASETNVVHFADIFPEGNCTAVEYKIEVYREGQSEPDAVRDATNDPNLAQRKEESFEQDNETIVIVDAWWSNQADNDNDGCVAPASRTAGLRLNWNAEVLGVGSVNVYAKIYSKPSDDTNWVFVASNAVHTIKGTSSADSAYAAVPTTNHCALMQYRIELFREKETNPVATMTPQSDPDLAGLNVESYEEDNILASLFGAWWGNVTDADRDGCLAPETADNRFQLNWDADVAPAGSLSVFEKVYYRNAGASNWTLLETTPAHPIAGSSGSDARYLDLAPGSGCVARDYRIEVYREGMTEPDAFKDSTNEPLLSSRREETFAQDNETATISRVWWTGVADQDGDGCVAPISAAGLATLNWDPDMAGTGSGTVLTKIYTRQAGSTNWLLLTSTQPQVITGVTPADAQWVEVPLGSGCVTNEYRLDIPARLRRRRLCAGSGNRPNLRQKEETSRRLRVCLEIIAQPENQTVESGGTTTIKVVAGGTQPLSYQWFFQERTCLAARPCLAGALAK